MSIISKKIFKGITVDGAIGSIGKISIESDHMSMTFSVDWKAPGSTEVFLTELHQGGYDIYGENPITQAYVLLDSFEGNS